MLATFYLRNKLCEKSNFLDILSQCFLLTVKKSVHLCTGVLTVAQINAPHNIRVIWWQEQEFNISKTNPVTSFPHKGELSIPPVLFLNYQIVPRLEASDCFRMKFHHAVTLEDAAYISVSPAAPQTQ